MVFTSYFSGEEDDVMDECTKHRVFCGSGLSEWMPQLHIRDRNSRAPEPEVTSAEVNWRRHLGWSYCACVTGSESRWQRSGFPTFLLILGLRAPIFGVESPGGAFVHICVHDVGPSLIAFLRVRDRK